MERVDCIQGAVPVSHESDHRLRCAGIQERHSGSSRWGRPWIGVEGGALNTRPYIEPPRPIHQMRGVSLLKVLLFIPLALVLMLILAVTFYEGRKAYWDYRVREMCAKDGGVKISEIIDVDSHTFESLKNKFGQIDIPRMGDPRSVGSIVAHSYKDVYIRRSNPEVRRSDLSVIKVSDGSVVATSTTYSRVGGDLLALHPSHVSCPSALNDFFALVVQLKGETK